MQERGFGTLMGKFEFMSYYHRDLALPLIGFDTYYHKYDAKGLASQLRRQQRFSDKKDFQLRIAWIYFKFILFRYEFVISIEYRRPVVDIQKELKL